MNRFFLGRYLQPLRIYPVPLVGGYDITLISLLVKRLNGMAHTALPFCEVLSCHLQSPAFLTGGLGDF